MASPQKSVNWQVGSSFSIKNLLNLPEDEVDSNGRQDDRAQSPGTASVIRPRPMVPDNFGHCLPFALFTTHHVPLHFLKNGFPHQEAVLGGSSPYANIGRRRPSHKTKERPLFSIHQVKTMEEEFDSRKYLTEGKRAELAQELKLTETQVKTWFQNRRTKWRKELRNENPPREVPDGRLKHSVQFARHFAPGHTTH